MLLNNSCIYGQHAKLSPLMVNQIFVNKKNLSQMLLHMHAWAIAENVRPTKNPPQLFSVPLLQPPNLISPWRQQTTREVDRVSVPPHRRRAGGSQLTRLPHPSTCWTTTIPFTGIRVDTRIYTAGGPRLSPAPVRPPPHCGMSAVRGLQTPGEPWWCSLLPSSLQRPLIRPPRSHIPPLWPRLLLRQPERAKSRGLTKKGQPRPLSPRPPSSPLCRAQVRVTSQLWCAPVLVGFKIYFYHHVEVHIYSNIIRNFDSESRGFIEQYSDLYLTFNWNAWAASISFVCLFFEVHQVKQRCI